MATGSVLSSLLDYVTLSLGLYKQEYIPSGICFCFL